MARTAADQNKSYAEVLIGQNRKLEEEVKTLKLQIIALEAEAEAGQIDVVNQVPLEEENERLKLQISELMRKIEVLEEKLLSIASGGHGDGQEDNPPPRKRRKIKSDGASRAVSSDKEKVVVNPLEIIEILENIMGHLGPLDLLKCRLVSKFWSNVAQKDFQERITFRVNSMDDVALFLTHSEKSFPNFRSLKVELADRPPPNRLKIMDNLFARKGQLLHKLDLNFAWKEDLKKWTLNDFRDIVLSSLEQIRELKINVLCDFFHQDQIFFPHHARNILRNLTTLHIELDCHKCRYNHISGKTLVGMDLIRMAPNLRTLHWRVVHCRYMTPNADESKNFIQSIILVNPINLENLFFHNAISEDLVRSISESIFHLKELYLFDFRGFRVHFFSTRNAEGKKCEIIPLNDSNYGGRTGLALKTHLENALDDTTENMSCTKLLQVFWAALGN